MSSLCCLLWSRWSGLRIPPISPWSGCSRLILWVDGSEHILASAQALLAGFNVGQRFWWLGLGSLGLLLVEVLLHHRAATLLCCLITAAVEAAPALAGAVWGWVTTGALDLEVLRLLGSAASGCMPIPGAMPAQHGATDPGLDLYILESCLDFCWRSLAGKR